MKRLVAVILISCITSVLQGQQEDKTENKNKSWYLAWGYTKAYYSRSTIHFKDLSGKYHPATGNNNYYDFTIYNVTAHDRPDLDKVKDVINITIPQFVVHAGYTFNDKWGFE
ncbi:MAG: hypothetical protein IT236_18430, partial [Bacteroidia bacterium]|nr:hypothetical protein [Bacteroidia bacterium]